MFGALAVLAACSADSPTAIQEGPRPIGASFEPIDPLPLSLCKSWVDVVNPAPAGAFTFSVLASDGGSTTVDVRVGECVNLGPYAPGTEVTITEILASGFELRAIWRLSRTEVDGDGFAVTEIITAPGTPSTTFPVDAYQRIFFKNAGIETPPPPPPSDFAGCTPGFWRQAQHFQYWTGYGPGDSFATVFGVTRTGTLLQNVRATGGGANALARHAVAALLNAASAEVEYTYSVAQIIAAVQGAFATGNFESVKNDFEAANELGCTVDKSQG
jgi:hypothetical protein